MTEKEKLKQEIFEKTKEYYNLVHKESESFIEGQTKVNYASRVFDTEELINLVDSSLDFWLTHGKYSKKFESEFAKYLGVRWSFLVNSGSSANLLAFFTLTSPLLNERQINRGDEVITVAACFPTTLSPIIQYGAVPVFVDIELSGINLDTTQLERALSSKTKAIMIAHTLGNPFDIRAIKEFCHKHNLWLIEDNCDALGSLYEGKLTGTWGDIGTSSFYPPHHMTMGEGGAVYTNNPLLKKIMLSLRDWGRDCWCASGVDNTCQQRFSQQYGNLPTGYDHKYIYSHFGFNLKATEMQAAIGVAQIKKLDSFTKKRVQNYKILYNNLNKYKHIFSFQTATASSQPSWFGFLLTLKENLSFTRNEIANYLEEHSIQTRNLFAGNILKHPLFDSLTLNKEYRVIGELTNTDSVMNNSFWVGVYPEMGETKILYMVKIIEQFIAERYAK